jgi:hypothetical protein
VRVGVDRRLDYDKLTEQPLWSCFLQETHDADSMNDLKPGGPEPMTALERLHRSAANVRIRTKQAGRLRFTIGALVKSESRWI